MIINNFRISDIQTQQINLASLSTVHLKNDNLVQFLIDWDEMVFGLTYMPPEILMEHTFRLQIEDSHQLKKEVMDYEKAVLKGEQTRSYDFLYKLVQEHNAIQKIKKKF